MAERGISIDHSAIHRWVVRFPPVLLMRFNRRKRFFSSKGHMDETYINVRGPWMYLYRAIDCIGDTVEFWLAEHRDRSPAKRFLHRALQRHGRPDRIVIDGAEPTGKQSFSAIRRTACRIGRGEHRHRFAFGRANPSRMYLTRGVLLRGP